MLKWILHDWNDERALQNLQKIREVMKSDAHLVVLERIMPSTIEPGTHLVLADLNMLCLNAGAERSEREFAAILKLAGFYLQEVVQIESNNGFHALIGSPVQVC